MLTDIENEQVLVIIGSDPAARGLWLYMMAAYGDETITRAYQPEESFGDRSMWEYIHDGRYDEVYRFIEAEVASHMVLEAQKTELWRCNTCGYDYPSQITQCDRWISVIYCSPCNKFHELNSIPVHCRHWNPEKSAETIRCHSIRFTKR